MIAYIYGAVRSQGVVRVRPAEFIIPKQIMIWPCKGRALHQSRVQWKNVSTLEPHNSVWPRLCPELNLSKVRLRTGMLGLVDFL